MNPPVDWSKPLQTRDGDWDIDHVCKLANSSRTRAYRKTHRKTGEQQMAQSYESGMVSAVANGSDVINVPPLNRILRPQIVIPVCQLNGGKATLLLPRWKSVADTPMHMNSNDLTGPVVGAIKLGAAEHQISFDADLLALYDL